MAPAKKKAEKMSLGDFLGDQSLGSWADEMEDMPLPSEPRNTGYGDRRAFTHAGGFGDRSAADRGYAERGFSFREQLPLPNKPPYTAHLGNLSFDATEGDIGAFFSECQVTSVRVVEDRIERKPKGFGYVEFATLDGLKKALDLAGTQFQGRSIRISVAEPSKERSERSEQGTRELNDWTRKGPLPDIPNPRRASERVGSFRNYDAASDAGSERGGSRRGGPMFDDNKVRDFGNWERKGPLSPIPSAAPPAREAGRLRGGEGPRERKPSPAWGEGTGRSQDGSRPPRREYVDRPHHDKEPTGAELDNQWRARMQPDKPATSPTATPDASMPPSPAAAPAPAARPRLNLQKRTVSEAPSQEPASASSEAKASIFGGARPIDTAAREKQIEEKRQLALRQKKEQDEKEREEKRLAKEQETAARAAQAEAARAPSTPSKSQTQANGKEPKSKDPEKENSEKENGASSPPANSGKQYEILRRLNEENADDEDAEQDAIDGSANGAILGDKEVKPQEIVRDIPNGPKEGETTTEKLEDDGWSIVRKERRGGGQVARAIAS